MPSVVDTLIDWLGGLGYTGTLQDRTWKKLLDEYTIAFGAPVRPLSSKDMAVALNKTLKLGILERTEWP